MIRLSAIGDSLTRAQLSADYLAPLSALMPGRVSTSRLAANGDFAWNLLQRLDEVVSTPADVVTVMIGTNDARASLPGFALDRWKKRKQLPTEPSAGWFEDCLGRVSTGSGPRPMRRSAWPPFLCSDRTWKRRRQRRRRGTAR